MRTPIPLRSHPLVWDSSELLPPRNEERYRLRGQYQAGTAEERASAPRRIAEVIAHAHELSRGKARKLVAAGKAHVKGPRGDGPVYDPDYELADDEHVVCLGE